MYIMKCNYFILYYRYKMLMRAERLKHIFKNKVIGSAIQYVKLQSKKPAENMSAGLYVLYGLYEELLRRF